MLRLINKFMVQKLAYLLGRLKAMPEAGGTVLKSSLVMFGSGLDERSDRESALRVAVWEPPGNLADVVVEEAREAARRLQYEWWVASQTSAEPLPDLPEDSGPILAIVSVKLADGAGPGGPSMPISSIGIELYGPLPGGVAVGGRFAPESIKVRGLREIDMGTAQAQPR